MLRRPLLVIVAAFAALLAGLVSRSTPATINHYEYVFTPGSVYVYDLDAITSTYSVLTPVKTVSLPNTANIGNANVRGAVASAASGMMYISYDPSGICCGNGHLVKYNLLTDQAVWDQHYQTQNIGTDSHSISPDGQTIYMPDGESTSNGLWYVIDANTGNILRTINSGGSGPHNTITNLAGTRVYMAPRYSAYLVVADAATGTVIQNIGPVLNGGIRPFTINSEETYAFITSSDFVGFSVGDIQTGAILYQVVPPGYSYTSSYNNASGVSHGISLSPNEEELYLIDFPHNHVHVFDVTGLPGSAPADVADIPLKCKMSAEGWLQHTRDGRFVIVGDCGDVIDTSTRQIVANLPKMLDSRIFNEVDFQGGVPSFSPLSRNQGGYGPAVASSVSLSATSLSFAGQLVGTGSAPQSVTLTNNGSSALSFTSLAVTGTNSSDFSQTNTCGISVAAGGNCSISVTFTPSASGNRVAAITITDSDPASPQIVTLTGTGLAAAAQLSPATLTFASQVVGTTSAPKTVTLTNTGTADLTNISISISGDFAQNNACPATLSPAGSCAISVTFKPAATGTRTGTLTVADNAAGNPQTVSLTGTGTAQSTTATVAPTSLSFGNQAVGSTSAAKTVTLTNSGSSALTISMEAIDKDFLQTNNCPASLSAGSNCTFQVTFSPSASGSISGALTITDSATNSPQTVSLSGTGLAPAVSLSPTSLTFASQAVGTTSAAKTVTLTNSGNAALTISTIAITGSNSTDFSQTNNCPMSPATLAAAANCTINVSFGPTAGGTRAGTLNITDNAPGSPEAVSLSGTGSAQTTPSFSLSATPTSATITAGAAATFTLNVSPTGGFNQPVALASSGTPPGATLSFSPNPVTPNGSSTATAKVTVQTAWMPARPQAPLWMLGHPIRPFNSLYILWPLTAVLLAALFVRRRGQARLAFGFATIAVLLAAGCAGLTSSSGGHSSGGTQASYTITLTGTSGSGSSAKNSSTTVTLTVN